jgi:hypothetical protein
MSARQQSSTSYPIMFFMTLAVDHTTGATGKTVTVTLSKNGGLFGAAAGAVTEVANGWYSLAGNATDRSTLGPLVLHATATGCDPYDPPAWDIITVDPFAAQFGITALPTAAANTTGGLSSDVLLGGTASAGTTNSITLAGGVATDNFYKYALVRIISGTGAGQTPRLILDYVGSSKVATVNKPWTTAPDNTSVFTVIPWSTPAVVSSGIAQAGGASTITLQSIANSTTDDIYAGLTITIFSGTGLVQSRIIQSYVASTRVATVDRAWAVNPDSTSVYEIAALGPAYADVFRWNGSAIATPNVSGVPKVDVVDWLGTAPLALSSQQVQSVVPASTVVASVTGSVGNLLDISAAVLARFFTRDSGSTYAASVDGSVVKEIADNASSDPTTIADAVWNRLTSALTTAGSVGKYIYDSLASVLAKTATIGAGTVTAVSSVIGNVSIQVARATDNYYADGLAPTYVLDGWPDITGGTVVLTVAKIGLVKSGVILSGASFYFEPNRTETDVPLSTYDQVITITLANGHVLRPIYGTFGVVP